MRRAEAMCGKRRVGGVVELFLWGLVGRGGVGGVRGVVAVGAMRWGGKGWARGCGLWGVARVASSRSLVADHCVPVLHCT